MIEPAPPTEARTPDPIPAPITARESLLARAREPLLTFVLALLVRLVHAGFLARSPFLDGPIIDSLTYWSQAQVLARTGTLPAPYFQPPLYPAILGLLASVGVSPGWSLSVVHSVTGAITAALLAIIARRLFGGQDAGRRQRVGAITGVAAALYGPFVLYDLEILPPAFIHLLLALALLTSLDGPDRGSWRDPIAGLLIGIATTGWGHSLFFLPGVVGLRARSVRGAASIAVLTAIGFAIPVGVTAMNNRAAGAPETVISWNGGLNLWLGNNPAWRETWRARPGAPFEPLSQAPQRAGAVAPDAQDRWFRDRVAEYVAHSPGAALGRTLEKLFYTWHGREIRRNQDFELLRDLSPILAALQWELGIFFPTGLVVPLAFISAWARRRERQTRALLVTLLVYSLAVASFFVATRYRLPMALLLLPLAADGLTRLLSPAERPGRAHLIAAVAVALVVNVPVEVTARFRADPRERLLLYAQAHRARGDQERVAEISQALLSRWPEDPNVQMLAAETAVHAGRCDQALPHLAEVQRLAGRATTPWLMSARCLEELDDLDGAERAYANALARDAHHAGALRGAALLYMRHGRAGPALALLQRLRDDGSSDDDVEFDLGRLLVEHGRHADALAILEPLAARRPNDRKMAELVVAARQAQRDAPRQ